VGRDSHLFVVLFVPFILILIYVSHHWPYNDTYFLDENVENKRKARSVRFINKFYWKINCHLIGCKKETCPITRVSD